MVLTLTEALDHAQRALTQAELEVERWQGEVRDLQQEVQGLVLAIHRHGGDPGPAHEDRQAQSEWIEMPRTTAIERVLFETMMPLSPTQITRRLAEVGRDDSGHAVSASLAHLSRKNRVRSVGRGQWLLATSDHEEPEVELKAQESDEDNFGAHYLAEFPSQNGDGPSGHATSGAPVGITGASTS